MKKTITKELADSIMYYSFTPTFSGDNRNSKRKLDMVSYAEKNIDCLKVPNHKNLKMMLVSPHDMLIYIHNYNIKMKNRLFSLVSLSSITFSEDFPEEIEESYMENWEDEFLFTINSKFPQKFKQFGRISGLYYVPNILELDNLEYFYSVVWDSSNVKENSFIEFLKTNYNGNILEVSDILNKLNSKLNNIYDFNHKEMKEVDTIKLISNLTRHCLTATELFDVFFDTSNIDLQNEIVFPYVVSTNKLINSNGKIQKAEVIFNIQNNQRVIFNTYVNDIDLVNDIDIYKLESNDFVSQEYINLLDSTSFDLLELGSIDFTEHLNKFSDSLNEVDVNIFKKNIQSIVSTLKVKFTLD